MLMKTQQVSQEIERGSFPQHSAKPLKILQLKNRPKAGTGKRGKLE
jgi:hypothetical protein